MYETAGVLTSIEHGSSLVWLVVLPLAAALAAVMAAIRREGHRMAMRIAIAASGGALGIAIVHAVRAAELPARHVFEQHVASIVRLGQLDLAIDLVRDPTSAALAVLVTVLSLAAVLHATWTAPSRSGRLAWTLLATAGVQLVVLCDDGPVVGVGLGIASLSAWALGGARRGSALGLALAGDAAFVLGAFILFWSLGGQFGTSGYTPDGHPRFALVSVPGASVPEGKAVVDLTTYEDALVTSDDGPPLPGEPLRSPFSVVVEPGVRSFRIQAGASTADMLVTHVTLAPGHAYVLTPYGPTMSARNLDDQLGVPRPTATGGLATRSALASRAIAGVSVVLVVALLVVASALFRLALLVRVDRGGLAHALDVVVAAALALRLAPLVDASLAGATASLAVVPAVGAVVFAVDAATTAPLARAPRSILASLGAFAVAAVLLGDPAAALLVAVTASLGGAAAIAACDGRGDVRWLGVACAGLAGILPFAGANAGVAGTIAGALEAAGGGHSAGLVVAPLLVVACTFVSLASFRIYGSNLRVRPSGAELARPVRVLVAVLAGACVLSGAALGAGTSAFGGSVSPLARRLAATADDDHGTRVSLIALALSLAAAGAGLLLARMATREGGEPGWLGVLRASSAQASRVVRAGANGVAFFAHSVRVLDAEVLDDAVDLIASILLRLASVLRRADGKGSAASSRILDRAAGEAAVRVGADDPRTMDRLTAAAVLGMVVLLGLVVLSSMFLG